MIAAGSMRMDKSEGLQYAYGAIERMGAREPEYFCFDIICHPYQKKAAENTIGHIRQKIKQTCPYLSKDNIFTGVATDFWERPGAEKMLRRLKQRGIDVSEYKIQDINPNREKDWRE